jgi:hypothetical protein
MSSSTWRVLNGYATYHRTHVRMISCGKWAPLKLTGIVSLPLVAPRSPREIIPQIASNKNCDRTPRGEVLRQELRYPLMTEEEIQRKFRDLVGLRPESRRVTDLERKLQAIESVGNVAPLINELELDY